MFNWNRSIVNIVKTPLHHKIIPVCGAFKPGGFKQRLKIVGIVKTLSQEEKPVCAETSADTIVSNLRLIAFARSCKSRSPAFIP